MAKKKIIISGAGPAGLSLACLLDTSKYDCYIVEQSSDFQSAGYSIILWNAGEKVLRSVVGDSLNKHIHPLNSFSVYGGENLEKLASSDTTGIGYSIEREKLITLLSKAYTSLHGKKHIAFNTTIRDITYDNGSPQVLLSDGRLITADLVIAADGMHSGIRNTHFMTRTQSDPFKITYCWLEKGSGLVNEGMIGFKKNFLFLIQTVGERSLLAYYNNGDKQENQAFLKSLSAMIRREKGGTLHFNEKSIRQFVSETVKTPKTYDRRLVLVGDALHGHPPTLAMGTTLALEDSYALTECLNSLDTNSSFDSRLLEALEQYQTISTNRTKSVYKVQDLIEKLIISNRGYQIKIMQSFIKHGGWTYVDHTLQQLFTKDIAEKRS